MFPRWRDEIREKEAQAVALWGDSVALVTSIVRTALVVGFGVGLLMGGFLVWLMK